MARRVCRPSDDEGMTKLMIAVSQGNIEGAKNLINYNGESLQARDKNGRNVLYHAFNSNKKAEEVLGMFQLLAEHGVDFNISLDMDGCSALITAITLDWPAIVQLLIEFGADIHDEGMSKFGASVSTEPTLISTNAVNLHNQHRDQSRFVFSKGCSQYVFPLLCATMMKQNTIVEILLSAGANCQQTALGSFWKSSNVGACSVCDVYVSPLHIAAYHGDAGLLKRLLADCRIQCVEENSDTSKAIVSSTSPEDITPLWLALLRGEPDAVKLLLEYDHPRAPPCHFGSGLYISLQQGCYDNARLLLKAGYDLWEDLEWIESELYPTTNSDIIQFIDTFIKKPPSLLVCSRNALRQHMGPRLMAYLSTVHIPLLFKDILFL